MDELKIELEKALEKRQELLLCGSNDEVLNDRIKELRLKLGD